jgi:hypothetical protein
MHPMQDYFWKDFYMHGKLICNLYALLCWQKFYSCKKWVLHIARIVLAHERTILCLDNLVMAHVLIVVIISHIGVVFLLQGLTSTLSLDNWMVHIYRFVVLVPLFQRVRCKRLLRLPQGT